METKDYIVQITDEIRELLLAKNKAYGDSAINPKRIFSKVDPLEQIRVRIDDKLSRIATGAVGDGHKHTQEDTRMDLIGYLVLEQVAMRMASITAIIKPGSYKIIKSLEEII